MGCCESSNRRKVDETLNPIMGQVGHPPGAGLAGTSQAPFSLFTAACDDETSTFQALCDRSIYLLVELILCDSPSPPRMFPTGLKSSMNSHALLSVGIAL